MGNPIGWCDITINPVVGCSHCNPGCKNCYAERFAARLAKNPVTAKKYAGVVDENGKWTGSVRYHFFWYEKLPKTPKKIFLNSMSDIFHPAVTEDVFYEIIDLIMSVGSQHIFFALTKRPERIKKVLAHQVLPPNLWLGTTVCNQDEADVKIPLLLQIQEVKNFVCIEPMLGPVDLTRYNPLPNWVICGGETGPGARPMHSAWARSLRDQCLAAGIPFFFKKMGNQKTAPKDLLIREVPNELETLPALRGN